MDEEEFEQGASGGKLGVLGIIIKECPDSACRFKCTFGEDGLVEIGYKPISCPYRRGK